LALFDRAALSATAIDALESSERNGKWYISAISIVELIYLSEKGKFARDHVDLVCGIANDPSAALEVLPLAMAEAVGVTSTPRDAVPDMPDRIIASTARSRNLPLVTKDGRLRKAPGLRIVW
jgi:PIN domain nuclease of toxin-antitoxin system